jgi:hypothetical protein
MLGTGTTMDENYGNPEAGIQNKNSWLLAFESYFPINPSVPYRFRRTCLCVSGYSSKDVPFWVFVKG